jgi:hypothetical protein
VEFLRLAGRALLDNYRPVLLYMAIAAAVKTGEQLFQEFAMAPIADETSDSMLGLYLIGSRIVLVALIAVADTIVFSRIGREVDKPYWRVADDREAFVRFYRLWLLLGLANLVYGQIIERAVGGNEERAGAFFLGVSYLIWIVLLHALGAAIMFLGGVARDEVSEAFAILGRHAPRVMGLCLFGIMAGILLAGTHTWMMTAEMPLPFELTAGALLAAIDGYVSCLLFVYIWLVCRYDRDHFERDREDFDL